MSNIIHTSYYQRVRYTLRNTVFRNKYIVEPIGWNEDEKELKRSTKVHGVFTNLSNNLKFHTGRVTLVNGDVIDGGYAYVVGVYRQQGINAQIILIKEEKNPLTDYWEEAYRGYLYFPSPMVIENNQVSIKFKESSFYHALQSRENEKLELERNDTMDGDDIGTSLSIKTVGLDGRDIFLVSKWVNNESIESPFVVTELEWTKIYEARALPFRILGKSDDSAQDIVGFKVDEIEESYRDGTTGTMFYADSTKDRTFTEIKINVNADFAVTLYNGLKVRLDLVTYENGELYEFKEFQTLASFTTGGGTGNITYSNTFEDYEILEGESLCLAFHVRSASPVEIVYNELSLIIKEDSHDDDAPKQAKFILPYEALERIIHITTGEEDSLVSNFLGRIDVLDSDSAPKYSSDGNGSLTGLTHGLWVRGFDSSSSETDENKFKPLTTSFRDFEESFNAVWNTGYGIERIGLKERIRFEEKDYFYQNVVAVSLPNQAKKIKRTVAKDYFYSSVELGYKKPSGENLYEEAMGLDEYNLKNTYTTVIKTLKNEYKKTASYRADSYGMEFTRRQSIKVKPTEDTRYDNDIFMMDLKRIDGVETFAQRLWGDDFAVAPTGVYSPKTAQNLRFSPMNMMLRHDWWIRAGLNVYKDSYVRFSSSTGNSNLTTQYDVAIHPEESGLVLTENGNIQVRDLDSPLFEPEIIEFQHEVTTAIMQTVTGRTVIDGEKVMNYYGLIEFINEDGFYEYGYLLNLKPNKDGKWKLLKSSKKVARKSAVPDPQPTELKGFDYELNLEIDG